MKDLKKLHSRVCLVITLTREILKLTVLFFVYKAYGGHRQTNNQKGISVYQIVFTARILNGASLMQKLLLY